MIKVCSCGSTIKRPLHDDKYCSRYCRTWYGEKGNTSLPATRKSALEVKCAWCGTHHEITFGQRYDKVYCSFECSTEAQARDNWLWFNYCRVLSHHPAGLTAPAIARYLDEYAFNQTPNKVSSKMRKLVRLGIVAKEDRLYRLLHPQACVKVWLSCL
jgi:hypothetical protein